MRSSFVIAVILAGVALLVTALDGCSDNATDPNQRVMSLSTTGLQFTSWAGYNPDPAQLKVVVSIDGNGSSEWTATANSSWLRIGPRGSDTIFVTAISDALSAGEYADTIVVTSAAASNSPLQVRVGLTVRNRLTVQPDSLTFTALAGGADPVAQTVVVSDFEAQGVTYEVSADVAWISLAETTGVVPETLSVATDITGLTGGQYRGSVQVTSPDLPESEATIHCRLNLSSWAKLNTGATISVGINLEGLHFSDSLVGWTSGWSPWNVTEHRGFAFRTEDGGDTWAEVLDVRGVKLGGLVALDNSRCWVVGDSAWVGFTSNAGGEWLQSDNLPLDSAVDLASVCFIDYLNGWIAGDLGTVIHTEDLGQNWTLQVTPTQHHLACLFFLDSQTGWVVGNHGTILHTGDAGATWISQASGTITDLRSAWFVDNLTGWVVGAQGGVLRTENGGASWSQADIGTTTYLLDIRFMSATRGWVVGLGGTIRHTNDGGVTWLNQPSGQTEKLAKVFFINDNLGWVAGNDGTILKTANGGF